MTGKENSITIRCPAKINLTLEILGVLPDGYHELKTLFQTVSLEDEITFQFTPADSDGAIHYRSYNSDLPGDFPLDDSNLISRAIAVYRDHVFEARQFDVHIAIKKNIPIGAGLAGGSANAAAALLAMNSFFQGQLEKPVLASLAAKLGADVAFSLTGGTCVGTHKGELLRPVEHENSFVLVLAKPRYLSISTPHVYKKYDDLVEAYPPRTEFSITDECAKNLKNGNLEFIIAHAQNDLERVVFAEHPNLETLRQQLLQAGVRQARLSGSGPTLYGIVSTAQDAESVIAQMHSNDSIEEPIDYWISHTVSTGARALPRD